MLRLFSLFNFLWSAFYWKQLTALCFPEFSFLNLYLLHSIFSCFFLKNKSYKKVSASIKLNGITGKHSQNIGANKIIVAFHNRLRGIFHDKMVAYSYNIKMIIPVIVAGIKRMLTKTWTKIKVRNQSGMIRKIHGIRRYNLHGDYAKTKQNHRKGKTNILVFFEVLRIGRHYH